MAPQEVIRAAYKALSQKYHPDKNPGDEKAARIMAILNSAYDTLSDTQRRREHDEWIAAEEWEIEWLESTRNEDGRGADKYRHDADRWNPEPVDEPQPLAAPLRKWKWWAGLAGCLVAGWLGGTMASQSALLDAALGGKVRGGAKAEPVRAAKAEPRERERDDWAGPQSFYPEADTSPAPKGAPVKVVAMSQIVLPGVTPDCDHDSQTLVSPNGEPWPANSGYIEGFSVGNRGDDIQLMVDNANNASAVFIKVYDVERRANVRYAYVRAHDKLMVDKLSNGKYEIRYQNLDPAANRGGCSGAGPGGGAAPSRTAAAEADTLPVSN
ncbi:J domain-containing protein [Oxalobacteraceae bacterium OTU3CINTB1]|nr:J domain-containing protein [Oxalobacteraceae bacterium OTU3CINTB1]